MLLRIATRASRLAMWQAEHVRDLVLSRFPEAKVEVVPIVTGGDQVQDRPLHMVGGKELFVRGIETALMDGEADAAVHCMKDFHAATPTGFRLAAILPRVSELDVLITRQAATSWRDLPSDAVIGTTSLRRRFALRLLMPEARTTMLRGNIDTRLARLEAGEFDAIVLAKAGLDRLGVSPHSVIPFGHDEMMPSAGQGTLGVEIRSSDDELAETLAFLDDADARCASDAERAVLEALSGDCHSIIGAYAHVTGTDVHLDAHIGDAATGRSIRRSLSGPRNDAARIGRQLAEEMLAAGAAQFVKMQRG